MKITQLLRKLKIGFPIQRYLNQKQLKKLAEILEPKNRGEYRLVLQKE